MKILNSSSEPDGIIIDKVKQTKLDEKKLKKMKKEQKRPKKEIKKIYTIDQPSSQSENEQPPLRFTKSKSKSKAKSKSPSQVFKNSDLELEAGQIPSMEILKNRKKLKDLSK